MSFFALETIFLLATLASLHVGQLRLCKTGGHLSRVIVIRTFKGDNQTT